MFRSPGRTGAPRMPREHGFVNPAQRPRHGLTLGGAPELSKRGDLCHLDTGAEGIERSRENWEPGCASVV